MNKTSIIEKIKKLKGDHGFNYLKACQKNSNSIGACSDVVNKTIDDVLTILKGEDD